MAVEQNDPALIAPAGTTYGRIVRERGTLKIVLGAVILLFVYRSYGIIHSHLLNQVKWPPLQPVSNGLTVVGLQNKDRPGFKHKYEARESNHAWQIRYRDDEITDAPSDDPDSPEAKDRGGSNPASVHGGNNGAVVPMEVVLKTCPIILTNAQFTGATLDEGFDSFLNKPYYKVIISLTEEGSSRYYQFSQDHDQERLAFILGDEVMACPRMSHMYVDSLTIDPLWIKADAERLINMINGKK
jgi:hypothetical protein